MEILKGTKNNKNRRCWYSADNDWEDLSIKQLQKLKRVTPFFLSPRKDHRHKLKKLKEFKLLRVDNVKIGDIGFRFKKDFDGHGIFEGQVIEINNTLRRCIYSDGDKEDLSMEKLLYWNNKYLLNSVVNETHTYPNEVIVEDEILEIPPFPPSSPSSSLPDSPPSTLMNNEDTVPNLFVSNNISFISQNVRSLRSKKQYINIDAIINTMEKHNISAYLIQETWLDGDFEKIINGYHLFHHGLKKQICKRGQKGIAIILSPDLAKMYNESGCLAHIENNIEFGRLIGIKLTIQSEFQEKGAFRKKNKLNGVSSFNLILISSYHPNEIENQIIFNNYLSSIYSEIPSSTILISGHDMNRCIGSKTKNCISIGKHGLEKINEKGLEAANLLRSFNLKAALTFYDHKHKITWKIFDGKTTAYQLD